MKISFCSVLTASLVTGLLLTRVDAQDAPAAPPTKALPAIVIAPDKEAAPAKAPAKKAPVKVAAKPAAKPAAKKVEAKEEPKSPPLLAPEPGVARQNNVNVRGQAKINSESVARLQKGEAITVIEEITLKKPAQDEPARWYKIALPPKVPVWVHSSFIDAATSTVKVKKLNLRGGPGENFSVLGTLTKGDTIKSVDTKGEWIKIETPTNAFGFVAAHLIERTPGAIVAAPVKPPEVAVVPPPVTPPVVTEVTTPAVAVVPGADVAAPPVTPPAVPAATNPPVVPVIPAVAEVLPDAPIEKVKKIASREGILKGSVSIQAPTYFELRSLDTGKTINYVYSPSTNLVLKEFKGQRVIVTGEELLDERWQNTPVILVDSLQSVP